MNRNGKGINNLEFKTKEVLSALESNRAQHKQVYEEAVEGYKAALIDAYKTAIADLDSAIRELEDKLPSSVYMGDRESIDYPSLVAPHHLDEYDTAIKMLEMTTDEKIVLTQEQFHCYVMDKWSWSQAFVGANSAYTTTSIG